MPIGNTRKGLSQWNVFMERIKMIGLVGASCCGAFKVSLRFSDGAEGLPDGGELLQRRGPLLEALRDECFFRRVFIDAATLCWPNGLELSPTKLRETFVSVTTA